MAIGECWVESIWEFETLKVVLFKDTRVCAVFQQVKLALENEMMVRELFDWTIIMASGYWLHED